MAEFRWTKTSLFLLLVLQFTAAAGEYYSFTVRDGDEVTLSCEHVQDKCYSTIWTFSGSNTVTLFELGQIKEEARVKSDRLSVTEKCSLVIKKVTEEDVGNYTCRQNRPGYQNNGGDTIDLSVVTITEEKDGDIVTFNCSVTSYDGCPHTVKWLYEGKKNDFEDPDDRGVTTSQSGCSATVSFPTSRFLHVSKTYELLKCKVTDGYVPTIKVFPFSPPQSSAGTGWSALNYIMLALHVAEVLLMAGITVLLLRARGNRRAPDDNTVHGDGDEHGGTVNYENVGEPSVSVRLP
ncbi:uncharacterized protein LOC114572867 [Perca flavescens]|uniref:uncharacterized protein LOC114572867 n=1 Tax=Perca flavescens TaxID=8167 RepID=UPI00106DE79A|nr:uncharacterized protein LOC114572867 [Perca flavescens]